MDFSPNWMIDFIKKVDIELITKLNEQKERFPSSFILISQFHKSAKESLNLVNGNAPADIIEGSYKQLKTKRNELCVAYEILFQKTGSYIEKLEYEPSLEITKKRIDFHVISDKNESYWIEVKTIHPDDLCEEKEKTKWDDYLGKKKYFSPRTDLILDFEFGGGRIWHDYYSVRRHMLDYAEEFEKRIMESSISDSDICILALVGNGYHWRKDHLEDFVSFYHGYPRPDDTFAKMQAHYIKEKDIQLSRRINKFAYFEHSESSMMFDVVNWNVKSPRWPQMK